MIAEVREITTEEGSLLSLQAAVAAFDITCEQLEQVCRRIEKGEEYMKTHSGDAGGRRLLVNLRQDLAILRIKEDREARALLALEAKYVEGRGSKVCRRCWRVVPAGEWCMCGVEGMSEDEITAICGGEIGE